MKQTQRDILGQSHNVLRDGLHFLNLPVKVDPANITADADGRKILKAGTILSATGTIVNDGTAYGIVYEEIDFTDRSKEAVPVIVHGTVLLSLLPVAPADTAKAAMKNIIFV